MSLLKLILIILATLLATWFFWDNRMLLVQPVPVVLRLPFIEMRPLPPNGPPIYLMLLVTFGTGYILAYVLGLYRRFQAAVQIRRLKKEFKNQGYRPAPASSGPASGAITPAATHGATDEATQTSI